MLGGLARIAAPTAAVAALVLVGCSGAVQEPTGGAGASSGAAAAFNDTDVVFAQGMVPHHEQAVEMAEIVLAIEGVDPRVVEVAEEIRAAQAPEIEQLDAMLEAWGQDRGRVDGHGEHGAHGGTGEGMMSPADLEALERAEGAEASRLFLEQMIEHHEGAVMMAQVEVDGGESAAAVRLAEAIVREQRAEIDAMRALLDRL
ncbi:DUF305 domain-containing protein [Agrococcus sp. TSP3-2-1]|uniref:DUF305 domain-containing protein n=1 Tax=Agrococcus sp. TSP3-2-1 TaxID=2804583 RepID=UPI003CFB9423